MHAVSTHKHDICFSLLAINKRSLSSTFTYGNGLTFVAIVVITLSVPFKMKSASNVYKLAIIYALLAFLAVENNIDYKIIMRLMNVASKRRSKSYVEKLADALILFPYDPAARGTHRIYLVYSGPINFKMHLDVQSKLDSFKASD